eukprot:TRINITY_DN49682_c0_g1_i1.p2 TRINITY_DN49682_c0_g1~~TRINITY_DN49682_c0_g1_i1.p2  ORF type:complete len:132 (-),score=10.84 TRINITY_DN49682_c0_g1_i1:100-447(-)
MAQGLKRAVKPKPLQRRPAAPKRKKVSEVSKKVAKHRAKLMADGRTHERDILSKMSVEDRGRSRLFKDEIPQVLAATGGGISHKKGKLRRKAVAPGSVAKKSAGGKTGSKKTKSK